MVELGELRRDEHITDGRDTTRCVAERHFPHHLLGRMILLSQTNTAIVGGGNTTDSL